MTTPLAPCARHLLPPPLRWLATLPAFLAVACGAPIGSSSATASPLFTASWTCTFTFQDDAGTTQLPTTTLASATRGDSLSLAAPSTDLAMEDWFCGYHYVVAGLGASLANAAACEGDGEVLLDAAEVELSSDGATLAVSEKGSVSLGGTLTQGQVSGTCTRQ